MSEIASLEKAKEALDKELQQIKEGLEREKKVNLMKSQEMEEMRVSVIDVCNAMHTCVCVCVCVCVNDISFLTHSTEMLIFCVLLKTKPQSKMDKSWMPGSQLDKLRNKPG